MQKKQAFTTTQPVKRLRIKHTHLEAFELISWTSQSQNQVICSLIYRLMSQWIREERY